MPQRIGVACSGGSDSLGLLLALRRAFPHAQLHVATVDHGLRDEAVAEAEFVGDICQGIGASHTILTVQDLKVGPNLQARARNVRYALLADWAAELDVVCLGHTKTDLAETFLMRLARGSGADGLAAMRDQWTWKGVRWARPLLTSSRQEVQHYLQNLHQSWCDDPSNTDERFTRVKMRNLQPTLDGVGLDENRLAHTSRRMGKIKTALDYAVSLVLPNVLSQDDCDVILNLSAFSGLPDELSERIFAMVLGWIGQKQYRPRISALQRAMVAARTTTLHGCVLIPMPGNMLRISREYDVVADLEASDDGVWDGRFSASNLPKGQVVSALGAAGLDQCPDWRATRRPRIALLSSPAIWEGERLICAPMAGFGTKECVHIAAPPWENALTR